jgi:hypothetical protein
MPLARRREPEPPPPHPRAGEEWFEALPAEKRAEFVAEWHASLARDAELARREVHGVRREALVSAGLMVFADLAAPRCTLLSFAGALVLGAAVAALLEKLRAERFLSGSIALALFLAWQYATRGGLSGMLVCPMLFVFACFAYRGWLREERGYD